MLANVLLVEDDPVSQKIICALLKKVVVVVTIAPTAEEARRALAENNYDLIIMDVNLPGISGIELTKQIREAEHGAKRHTLIVALTGNKTPEDRQACLDSGMDGFFTKPINRMQFTDFLKKVLKSD